MKLVRPGTEIETVDTPMHIPRHRHAAPYAALVLSGGYCESGDRGRFKVGPGDVLIHHPFEAHQDIFNGSRVKILNLSLTGMPMMASGRVRDPDTIALLAERDPIAAAQLLQNDLLPGPDAMDDWPDRLASALTADTVDRIEYWAAENQLAPATVSRGFRAAFGIAPSTYRLEQRARRAAMTLLKTRERCAVVAAECGFADQAHMSRTVRRLYETTPAQLRAA